MKTVRVNKHELIELLKKNRNKHEQEYKEAFKGYIKISIEKLEESLEQFKAGKLTELKWREAPPRDNTKDYDRVLEMLKLSVDNEIELTNDEFSNYVQDDWSWKDSWLMSNTKYLSK